MPKPQAQQLRVEHSGQILWTGDSMIEAKKIGAKLRADRKAYNIVRMPSCEIVDHWGW